MKYFKLLFRSTIQRINRKKIRGLTPYYVNRFESRLEAAIWQLSKCVNSRKIIDIGCGRDLHMSLIWAIKYGKPSIAYDVSRLADLDTINFTIKQLNGSEIKDLSDLCQYNISYKVCSSIGLINDDFDAAVSTASFEHIQEEQIEGLVNEVYKRLPIGGVFCANIDYRDHWSYIYNIPAWNFYTLSNFAFRLINNDKMFQNRLRHSDFQTWLLNNGFEKVDEILSYFNELPEDLNFSNRFRRYTRDSLKVSSALISYRKTHNESLHRTIN